MRKCLKEEDLLSLDTEVPKQIIIMRQCILLVPFPRP